MVKAGMKPAGYSALPVIAPATGAADVAGAVAVARGVNVAVAVGVEGGTSTRGGTCDLTTYKTATPRTRMSRTAERVARARRIVTAVPPHFASCRRRTPRAERQGRKRRD